MAIETKVTQKRLKKNIKKAIEDKGVSILLLSKRTHINIITLFFLIYSPVLKVKLTKAIKICKALELKLSDILV